MKLLVQKGKTSVLANIFIQDSSSTIGAGLTGLAFNTSGLVCYRSRGDDGNAGGTAISLATMTRGTWATAGFVEKDATNMPGVYEIGLTNASLAAGSDYCVLMFKGATNMAPVVIEIELIAADLQDSVRAGLTALPNAAAGANGGLPLAVDASGRVDVLKINGTSQTARDIGASVLLSAGTGTGQLDFTSGVVKSSLVQILGTALTETAGQIAAAFKKFFDKATPTGTINSIPDAVAGAAGGLFIAGTNAATAITTGLTAHIIGTVDTLTTYTGNTLQTGDTFARLGAPAGASVSADIAAAKVDTAAIKVQTDKMVFTVANQVDVNVIDWKGATAPAMTGDAFARIGVAGAGLTALGDTRVAHLDADVSSRLAASSYTAPDNTSVAAIKTKTDSLTFTVTGMVDSNVIDWKGSAAPAMTGDAFARLGPPTGASISADVAGVQSDTDNIQTRLPAALVGGRIDASIGAMASGAITSAGFASGALDAVWSTAVRVLTAGTNIVLAKGVGVTGLNDLDAAGIRTAAGLAAANLDTQLAAINTKTVNLPAAPAAVSDIPTANANADAMLDRANAFETGLSFRGLGRLLGAVLGGKVSGAGTGTELFRNAVADSKTRLTVTDDSSGNRTAISTDLT